MLNQIGSSTHGAMQRLSMTPAGNACVVTTAQDLGNLCTLEIGRAGEVWGLE